MRKRLRDAQGRRTSRSSSSAIGYGKIDPEDDRRARRAAGRGRRRESKPPESLREGRIAGLVRKVIERDERRHPPQRHRRRARSLRQVLQPAAGRRHHRLHHARPRRHRSTAASCTKAFDTDPGAARRDHLGLARPRSTARVQLRVDDREPARHPGDRRPDASARRASTSARPTAAPATTGAR